MLPKPHRLPGYMFPVIKKKGKIFYGQLFSLLILKREEKREEKTEDLPLLNGKKTRFGMVVSKKVHKLAVQRNRVKRLWRQATRAYLEQTKPGFDCLFLSKKTLLTASLKEVEKAVEELLKKCQLI